MGQQGFRIRLCKSYEIVISLDFSMVPACVDFAQWYQGLLWCFKLVGMIHNLISAWLFVGRLQKLEHFHSSRIRSSMESSVPGWLTAVPAPPDSCRKSKGSKGATSEVENAFMIPCGWSKAGFYPLAHILQIKLI